jgi:hypothetical protein
MKRRQVVAAAFAATMVVLLLSPAITMADAVTFDSYSASAESWGLDIRVAPIGQQVPDFTDQYYPHTKTTVGSLPRATADGEFFDPGGTARIGPALGNYFICNQNSSYGPFGPFGKFQNPCYGQYPLPNYPFIAATTSDPNQPRDVDASSNQPFTPEPGFKPLAQIRAPGYSTPTGFASGAAHAHADVGPYSHATGTVQSISQGLLSVGSADGESSGKQAGGVVSAWTTTTLKNVNFAGVYHADSITVTARIETSGPGTAKASQQVMYNGVTVNNVGAFMDQDGLHIGGTNNVPIDVARQAADALNKALSQSQMQMVPPHATSVANPDGSVAVTVDGGGMAYNNGNVAAVISFGHATLAGRAVVSKPVTSVGIGPLGTPIVVPQIVEPDSSITFPGTSSSGTPVVHHKRLAIILEGSRHLLILPFVAVVSEIALVLLVFAANRWRKQLAPSRENLLAL